MEKQKKIFLKFEANKFYKRNIERLNTINYKNDKIFVELKNYLGIKKKKLNLLEVGCCDAGLINFISQHFKHIKCHGIDPSSFSIKSQKNPDLNLKVATADKLPFKNDMFDILIYNFCLYLSDDEDLTKIIFEADRVLKNNGVIFILDFYHKQTKYIKYVHHKGVFSRKMDYSKLFLWHPKYELIKIKKFKHKNRNIHFKDKDLNTTSLHLIKRNI